MKALILILAIILSGCGEQPKIKPAKQIAAAAKTLETSQKPVSAIPRISQVTAEAHMISSITFGLISPEDRISVRFSSVEVEAGQIGVPLKKEVFSFTPPLAGSTRWDDGQTLIFVPQDPLKMRQKYLGKLDKSKLFPDSTGMVLKEIPFEFETTGREISDLAAGFELVDTADPASLVYKGRIKLSQKTSLEVLVSGIKLNCKGTPLELKIADLGEEREFGFQSGPYQRTDEDQEYSLHVDAAALGLAKNRDEIFHLPPLKYFAVENLREKMQGKKLFAEIAFSDLLDERKDYQGFVQLQELGSFKLKAVGKFLVLNGDFQSGKTYQIRVLKGLKSRWGTELTSDWTGEVTFRDMQPAVEFCRSGYLLPTSANKKIDFRTANVRKVHLLVKKVFENNLSYFIQDNRMQSAGSRKDFFYNVERLGVVVSEKTLEIGEETNKWLQSELDLSDLFKDSKKGLYVIELSMNREDIICGIPDEESWSEFYYRHCLVTKPIILTDIGLTVQKEYKRTIVYANNLLTTEPLAGTDIKLLSYQNQTLARGKTDLNGRCEFPRTDAFLVEAERDGQQSLLKFNESELDTTLFETAGEEEPASGTRAFTFTDRGVYRPGETVNLTIVLRNQDNTFPDNHPVTIKLYDPLNRKVNQITSREGADGIYCFTFATDESDPTGNWNLEINAGDASFSHTLKIETIVPYRLKLKLASDKEILGPEDREIKATLHAEYLFGNPGADLASSINMKIVPRTVSFEKYRSFSFRNEGLDFQETASPQFDARLNSSGDTAASWKYPSLENVPSALNAVVDAKVLEKGGRPVPDTLVIPIEYFDRYVGIRGPEDSYLMTGSPAKFQVMLVSGKGEPVSGIQLTYRVYLNHQYWWWDYENENDFKKHFKTAYSTELIESGTLSSGTEPAAFEYTPEEYGELLVEVQDGDKGHTAGYFFRAYAWGSEQAGKDASTINLVADKTSYSAGETARIALKTPGQGRALVSVEKGGQVLSSSWYELKGNDPPFEVPITEAMAPTSYVFVNLIQPHAQTKNNRPLRMYGVIPLAVEERNTRLLLNLKAPEVLGPGQSFDLDVQTPDEESQVVLAVVDEGLLSLTRFQTPDPWSYFNQKQRLSVATFDTFSDVIGFEMGEIFKHFTVGGDGILAEMSRQAFSKAKRFKPVALFKGPVKTGTDGLARFHFTMPNYVGAVRVMALAFHKNHYASTEKSIPVKSPLMILPTLPRQLGPDDQVRIPVTVFAMEDGLGSVEVRISADGPVKTASSEIRSLNFEKKGDQDLYFVLKADQAVGVSLIQVSAKSGSFSATETAEIAVRPVNPYIYSTEIKIVSQNETASMVIPDRGLKGTNKATFMVSRNQKLKLGNRLHWLLEYPYGCVEQTVSSVFPQLYLGDLLKNGDRLSDRVDRNINGAIRRLAKFQLPSGGFTYWPGMTETCDWGTNYAGHFLLEADRHGYHVSQDMLDNWKNFEKSRSLVSEGDTLTRCYRVYLLALAGEAQMGAMNLIKETMTPKLDDTSKWLLAAAYKLAGVENTAQEILKGAGLNVGKTEEFSGTFGSNLRDRAIILEIMTLFGDQVKSLELYNQIADELSTDSWLSTQSVAYALLSMGKFMALQPRQSGNLTGELTLPGGKTTVINSTAETYSMEILEGFGDKLIFKNSSTGNLFASMEWEGIPACNDIVEEQKNLTLYLEWLDDDGSKINPENIKQGTTFWGHFTVIGNSGLNLSNIALLQILPSGWEIDNLRLAGTPLPAWTQGYTLNQEKYLDIRDDRIMWFLDLPYGNTKQDFLVKLNPVSIGRFFLSPTIVHAMYEHNYRASVAGKTVEVTE
ncbi:MAG: MG2 domain-containing protein [Candidatus Wallbacteria bacterium]|nr:MG2 domain-containing protein [Candidatus Wallbacteria bacterium]